MNILNEYFIKRMCWLILVASTNSLVYVNYFCLCEFLFHSILHILLLLLLQRVNRGNILVGKGKYMDYTFHKTIIGALPPEFHRN